MTQFATPVDLPPPMNSFGTVVTRPVSNITLNRYRSVESKENIFQPHEPEYPGHTYHKRRHTSLAHGECRADVVFIVSQPLRFRSGTRPVPTLNYDKEEGALISACTNSNRSIRYARRTASISSLREVLTTRCRVLHYCGHGLPHSLLFEDDEDVGVSKIIPSDVLETLVQAGSEVGVEVVVVSACHSRSAGNAFVRAGVPHVVAVQRKAELNDCVTKTFIEHFYTSLLAHETVADAFDIAVKTVSASFMGDEFRQFERNKFILLPRDADHDVHVFDDLTEGNFEIIQQKSAKSYTRPLPPEESIMRHDLALDILHAVQHNRLTILTGDRGVGKSYMAHVVCHYFWERDMFRDGIFEIDCSNMERIGDVVVRVSNELHQADLGIDRCHKPTELAQQLRNTRCLIVLDGVDLQTRRINTLVCQLLRKTDGVKLLVTMRDGKALENFSYQQKQPVRIPPLSDEDAMRLFARSAPKPIEGSLMSSPIIRECEGNPALLVYASTLYFHYDTLDSSDMLQDIRDRKESFIVDLMKKRSPCWVSKTRTPPRGKPKRFSSRHLSPTASSLSRSRLNPFGFVEEAPYQRRVTPTISSRSESDFDLTQTSDSLSELDGNVLSIWQDRVGQSRFVEKDIAYIMFKDYYKNFFSANLRRVRALGSTQGDRRFLTGEFWKCVEDVMGSTLTIGQFQQGLECFKKICEVIMTDTFRNLYFHKRHLCIAGFMSKNHSKDELKFSRIGSFLFRFSSSTPGDLVLCCKRSEKKVTMYKIAVRPRSRRPLSMTCDHKEKKTFASINELVKGLTFCRRLWTEDGLVPVDSAFSRRR